MRVGVPQDRGRRDGVVDQRDRADHDDHHAQADGDDAAQARGYAVARRRRSPNKMMVSPIASPPMGSQGIGGWDALAAGKGIAKVTATSPSPALTPEVKTPPAGPRPLPP